MATPKGFSTSSALSKLQANPMHQQKMQTARGLDNRAVQTYDRAIGKELAQEQTRLLGLKRAGEEISRRKDSLDFAKKTMELERKSFEKRETQRDEARDFKRDVSEAQREFNKLKFNQSNSLHNYNRQTRIGQFTKAMGMANSQLGLELGLGVAATGVNIYRQIQSKRNHEEFMQSLSDRNRKYKGINYNYSYVDTEE